MKTYFLKNKSVVLSDAFIEYNGVRLSRSTIYDWHFSLGYFNGFGTAELKFEGPEGAIKLSIEVNSYRFFSKASDNAIQQMEELFGKVFDNKIVQNFLLHASNSIREKGKFKTAGVNFYKDKVACGLIFPLEVPYKSASITTSRFETRNSKKTGVFLNDGARDKETQISSHLSGTDIQKLKILIQYLPQFLN